MRRHGARCHGVSISPLISPVRTWPRVCPAGRSCYPSTTITRSGRLSCTPFRRGCGACQGSAGRSTWTFPSNIISPDATQDLLAVVPPHDRVMVPSLSLSPLSTHKVFRSVLVCALSTGQPHPLSANGRVFHLEGSRFLSFGKQPGRGLRRLPRVITWRISSPGTFLTIWNWKTGVLHVNTVRDPPQFFISSPLDDPA